MVKRISYSPLKVWCQPRLLSLALWRSGLSPKEGLRPRPPTATNIPPATWHRLCACPALLQTQSYKRASYASREHRKAAKKSHVLLCWRLKKQSYQIRLKTCAFITQKIKIRERVVWNFTQQNIVKFHSAEGQIESNQPDLVSSNRS